ncbi:MAG: DUF3847 domain-containing protein [Defluviitaleaceae bacterium]|nr:DUF3847 domain-containing protein [Defluviitaleaceae bacterium]
MTEKTIERTPETKTQTRQTRAEKIDKLNKQITQLENRRKQELKKHKQDERKARTKRLIERGAILESLIDGADAETLGNEHIKYFLQKIIQTDHAKNLLLKIKAGIKEATERGETEPSN